MYYSQMTPYEGNEKYIFVSYSHLDADEVLPILDALSQKGYRIWYDEGITPGSEWPKKIAIHLAAAEVCIAFISPYYVESDNCNNEINYAFQKKIKVLGVLLRETDLKINGIDLQLASKRYLSRTNYPSEEKFLHEICLAEGMDACREPAKEPCEPVQPETAKGPEVTDKESAHSAQTPDALLKRGFLALDDSEWDKAAECFAQAQDVDPHCAEAYLGRLLAREKVTDADELFKAYSKKYEQVQPEVIEACEEDAGHFEETAAKYAVGGYLTEDAIREKYRFDRSCNVFSTAREKQKDLQLQELQKNRLLNYAMQDASGDLRGQLEKLVQGLAALWDSRIAEAEKTDRNNIAKVKAACQAAMNSADEQVKALSKTAAARREKDYQNALSLMQSAGSIADYEAAAKFLEKQNNYKNAAELLAKCRVEADRLKAEQRGKHKKAVRIIAGCLVLALIIGIVAYVRLQPAPGPDNVIPETASVTELPEASETPQPTASQIPAPTATPEPTPEPTPDIFASANVGDIITFGTYEQDNNTTNGTEDIEWLVLDKTEDSVLLISRYALDCRRYNDEYAQTTWETCSLRSWLNDDFYNSAFSASEQAQIAMTTVSADKNPDYSTDAGNDTEDKVFVLSINEAKGYFTSDEERQCQATEHAIAEGAVGYTGSVYWWLRSPGSHFTCAANVIPDGSVYPHGDVITNTNNAVRPVIRVTFSGSASATDAAITTTPVPTANSSAAASKSSASGNSSTSSTTTPAPESSDTGTGTTDTSSTSTDSSECPAAPDPERDDDEYVPDNIPGTSSSEAAASS